MSILDTMAVVDACRKRAIAGAAYLDEKMPGWRGKIMIGKLNMGHQNADIGGQILGDYVKFYEALGFDQDEERDLGFAYSFREFGGGNVEAQTLYYKLLTRAWQELLSAPRGVRGEN